MPGEGALVCPRPCLNVSLGPRAQLHAHASCQHSCSTPRKPPNALDLALFSQPRSPAGGRRVAPHSRLRAQCCSEPLRAPRSTKEPAAQLLLVGIAKSLFSLGLVDSTCLGCMVQRCVLARPHLQCLTQHGAQGPAGHGEPACRISLPTPPRPHHAPLGPTMRHYAHQQPAAPRATLARQAPSPSQHSSLSEQMSSGGSWLHTFGAS